MKTVYRVENPNGDGPYWDKGDYYESDAKYNTILNVLKSHKTSKRHLPWKLDFTEWQETMIIMNGRNNYISGFNSIKDVFKWFGGLIPQFYKLTDFRIVKYQVSDYDIINSISGNQIIFKKPMKEIA